MAITTTSNLEEPAFAPQAQLEVQPQPQPQPVAYSSGNTPIGNANIPVPNGFIALRIAQLIVAIVVLGLTGFLISNNVDVSFSVIYIPHCLYTLD